MDAALALRERFHSEETQSRRNELFRNGYIVIPREEFRGVSDFLARIDEINADDNNFEAQSRQRGTSTLKASLHGEHRFVVDYLFDSGVMEAAIVYTGQMLHMTNFRHYLTRGGERALGWHRDTHFHRGSATGLVPACYKIILYSSVSDPDNACTELIAGSHRVDFHNKWIDQAMGRLGLNRHRIIARPGDVAIFNVGVLHNRLAAKPTSFRSATIVGMALSSFYQKRYYVGENCGLLDHYNARLEEFR